MHIQQTQGNTPGTSSLQEPQLPSPIPRALPRLLRASEIQRDCAPDSPLRQALDWVRHSLTQPHPLLGRTGPVCPFVPVSLKLDTIWFVEIAEADLSFEYIATTITQYRDMFLAIEPTSGPDVIYKSFLTVFPALAGIGAAGPALVDKVQQSLKKYFVDMGLMIGEFHATNESPGLRNPEFRPLRSPIPMLAIRRMVDSDLPFLVREEIYTAKERSSFLRSYLSQLAGTLSPSKFDQALGRLIVAEIEIWIDKAKAGEATALSNMFRTRYESEGHSMSATS
jgi:hypothetical protein